jgi:hypothetical protein
MGMLMMEDDIYIPMLMDLFNLRFAPTQESGRRGTQPLYGGIMEMAALQREFQIFKTRRPFAQSAAVLGLGGLVNNQAKNRWNLLLSKLPDLMSDKPDENGDQRIVNALITNLKGQNPLPCFMCAHDWRDPGANRVIVREIDRPVFYLNQQYLTISLPMQPRRKPKSTRVKK